MAKKATGEEVTRANKGAAGTGMAGKHVGKGNLLASAIDDGTGNGGQIIRVTPPKPKRIGIKTKG